MRLRSSLFRFAFRIATASSAGAAFFAATLAGALASSGERTAHAAEEMPKDTPPQRRDGFLPAFTFHSGIAHASGFPNDVRALGNPALFSSSDILYGTTLSFHVGYALTDYVTFGFLLNFDRYESAHWLERAWGGGMRIDAFPLLYVMPRLGDLGVFGEVGLGTASLDPKIGAYPNSEGTQTYLAAGAFYELTLVRWHASHLTLAPELKYTHVEAISINTDAASVGLRLAFYASK